MPFPGWGGGGVGGEIALPSVPAAGLGFRRGSEVALEVGARKGRGRAGVISNFTLLWRDR